jgi:uncharacterized protein (TIGR03085 family)
MGGPLAGYTARSHERLKSRKSFAELIEAFRNGPPRFSPFALPKMDEAANTVEYFVHHEDVRRAGDDWGPRELDPALSEALWSRLKSGGRFFVRSAPVGVELARDEGAEQTASPYRVTVKRSAPLVTVTGSPAELTLWAFGRVDASNVRLDGPKDAINQLQAWRRLFPGVKSPGGLAAHLLAEAVQLIVYVGPGRTRRRRGVVLLPEVVVVVVIPAVVSPPMVVAQFPVAVPVADLAAAARRGDLVGHVAATRDEGGDHDIAEHVEDEPNHAANDQEGNQRADRDGCDLEPVHSGAPFSSPSIII